MNFIIFFLILSLIFVASLPHPDARNIRAVDLYTRECKNNTCKYVLHVSNTEIKPASGKDPALELGPIKVFLQQLKNSIQKDAIKTIAITRGLAASVISLTGELQKLQKRYNFTATSAVTLQQEVEILKHNVSSVLSGIWQDVQPITSIVHPASPDHNLQKAYGTDCASLFKSGVNTSAVYTLQPDPGSASVRFEALCDMQNSGGGWTIIQRRVDGSDDFFRGWKSYKHGFGDLNHDFWLGLDKIHILTKFGNTKMRIDLQDWEGQSRYSEFSYVRVSDEVDGYRILAGKYEGNAGDPFHTQRYSDKMQSMRFSTFDRDNDLDENGNCAMTFNSGWWFNNCFLGNLNGVWYDNSTYVSRASNGIIWDLWTEHPRGYSLMAVEIKLRPEDL